MPIATIAADTPEIPATRTVGKGRDANCEDAGTSMVKFTTSDAPMLPAELLAKTVRL